MSSIPVKTIGSPGLKAIPRVRTRNPLGSAFAFRQDPLHFIASMAAEYGDIFQFRLLTIPIVVINHPDYIKHILVDNQENYDKDVFLFHVVKPVLRNGLIANEGGKNWLHQRRLTQPAFHRQRIATLGKLMSDTILEKLQQWEQEAEQGHPLNVTEEMGRLTLQIVIKSLFGVAITEKAPVFEGAFTEANNILGNFTRFPFPPLNVPTPSHRRLWKAIGEMDEIVDAIIRLRQGAEETGDLLSLLMQTVDEETGEGMDVPQLHDEILNVMAGGYETTTNTISWIWYILAQHSEIEKCFHEEIDRILAERTPTVDDFPQLTYTRMLIDEALRFYPPAWQVMRRACGDDVIDGYHIPANTTIFWTQYTIHRHVDFWENPEQFDPERFLPEKVANRSRYAYIPFSSGPRICIGNNFALTEIMTVLVTIAQRYRLTLIPGPPVETVALITLRPSDNIRMRMERR